MSHAFLNRLDDYIKERRYRLVNAVLVLENGEVAFERYYNNFAPESRNHIKSVWKSVIALTLGVCLDKGLIKSLDEPICRYLPQFGEGVAPLHKLITVRHLLTMTSGIYWNGGVHYHCPMMEQMRRSRDWVSHIADVKMNAVPGTVFQYKEWDVILASAVIGAAGGGSAWDVCAEHLYKPLNISSDVWTRSKCGVSYPSYGDDPTDKLSVRDMVKIGQLMLNGGVWNGERVVSEKYVGQCALPSEAGGEYGMFWWLGDGSYAARGFGGQEVRVYPKDNAVIALQATVTPSSKSYLDICDGIMSKG